MRGIRRPPSPPAEPLSSSAEANPRGRRDARETAAEPSIMPQSQIPDLFADAEYSSDESEADDDIRGLDHGVKEVELREGDWIGLDWIGLMGGS